MSCETNTNVTDVLSSLVQELVAAFPAIDVLYLFGSAAQGGMTAESDLDVAVFLNEEARRNRPVMDLEIGVWLQDRLHVPIDVVVMNRASAVMQHEVLRTGRRLYERAPMMRARRELRAFKDYLDAKFYQDRRMKGVLAHG